MSRWKFATNNWPIMRLAKGPRQVNHQVNSHVAIVQTEKYKNPVAKVKINNCHVKFTLDTGSTINVIVPKTFNKFGKAGIKRTKIKAHPFNSNNLLKRKGSLSLQSNHAKDCCSNNICNRRWREGECYMSKQHLPRHLKTFLSRTEK